MRTDHGYRARDNMQDTVYLFGSLARGEAGPDSDYDIMVVVPGDSPPERLRSRLAYRALRGTGAAAGVLVWAKRCRIVAAYCDSGRNVALWPVIPSWSRRQGLGSLDDRSKFRCPGEPCESAPGAGAWIWGL
ncbi:MAG: nucleotidyltransferase domain-containing protein [Acidobacteriia bacterium]|nr:nucleotidyltransferase domain-containing protein [Terriglobia bacterium]